LNTTKNGRKGRGEKKWKEGKKRGDAEGGKEGEQTGVFNEKFRT